MDSQVKKYSILWILAMVFTFFPFSLNAEEAPPVLEKLPGTAAVIQENLIYGEGVPAPQVSSETNDSAPLLSYKIRGAKDSSYSEIIPKDAGTYTVQVVYPETDTHLEARASADFTIHARITSISLPETRRTLQKTYDGTSAAPILQGLPFQFTVEGTEQMPLEGRDYEILSEGLLSPAVDEDPESLNLPIRLSFPKGLYVLSQEVTQDFLLHADILKAPLTVTARNQLSPEGYETGIGAVTVQGLCQGDTLEEISLTERSDRLYPENARIFRGEKAVTDQYAITYVPGELIHSASLSDYPVAAEGLIYTGENQPLLTSPGVPLHGTMVYRLTYHASQSSEEQLISDWSSEIPRGKAPGIYTVSFYARGKGVLNSPQMELVVILSPRPLTVTAAGEKIYDGRKTLSDENVSVTLDPSMILPGEEVSIKTVQDSNFETVAAGEHLKIIPGNVILGGRDAQNYSVKVSSFEGTIHRRPIEIRAKDVTKAYGQKDPPLSYEVTGLAGSEILSGSPAREPGDGAGTYAVTQGSLTEERNPNYQIRFQPGHLTITPADCEIRVEFSGKYIRPGRTLAMTIWAKGPKGAELPEDILLKQGEEILKTVKMAPGKWHAEFKVPRDAAGALTFGAAAKDPNYHMEMKEAALPVRSFSLNPRTGDLILFYVTMLLLSGGILLVLLYLNHRKNR